MTEKVKIAIDLMGGDNSPDKTLEGIDLFIQRNLNLNDYFFYLYGDKDLVLQKLKNLKFFLFEMIYGSYSDSSSELL